MSTLTLTRYTAGAVLTAADLNSRLSTLETWGNNTVMMTDQARTVIVTHIHTAPQQMDGGSVSLPGIYFDSNPTTGLFGGTDIRMALAGVEAFKLDGTGLSWGGGAAIADSGAVMQESATPTWTGAHIFNAAVTLNSDVDIDVTGAEEFEIKFGGTRVAHFDQPNDVIAIGENNTDVLLGSVAATTSTEGFAWLPSVAGVPTGTPPVRAGFIPFVVDTAGDKLYMYDYTAVSWVIV